MQLESDQWRELCSDLTVRLEELACFLDSLLRSGDVLGLLGERRIAIRLAVDRSLDLSRSVSLSVSAACLSMRDDQSLVQLSSLSKLLDSSDAGDKRDTFCLVPTSATLTFNSHLDVVPSPDSKITCEIATEQAKVIEALRKQVETLKEQIVKKNTCLNSSINRSGKSRVLKADVEASESEAWSEPDRNVSFARIGLPDTAISTVSPQRSRCCKSNNKVSLNTSETDDKSDTDTIKLQDQISSLKEELSKKETKLLEGQCALLQADNSFKEEKLKMAETFEALKSKIFNTEKSLEEALAKLKLSEENVQKLNALLEEMTTSFAQEKDFLTSDHEAKYKCLQTQIKTAESDKRVAVIEAEALQQAMLELENNIASVTSEKDSLQTQFEKEVHELTDKFKKDLLQNWVTKTEFEKQLIEYNKTCEMLGEKEHALSHMTAEYESKLSKLEQTCRLEIEQVEK